MALTTTNPFSQRLRVAYNYWTNNSSLMWKALQVGGVDYTGGTDYAVIKALTIFNNLTATASTFGIALLDPSAPTVVQTGTLTSGATTCTGLSDTTLLFVGMPISGTGIATGTFISAIVSSTAVTLSKNATSSGAQSLTFTAWNIRWQVTVPAASGGAAAGTTINVDVLGSLYVTGLVLDQSSKPIIYLPTGYKLCAFNLTAPAANNGGFIVSADIEEF